jgi:hypothetical protein
VIQGDQAASSRPGFGFYTFLSADFYYMIQDLLR